jgi:hypothetical protein
MKPFQQPEYWKLHTEVVVYDGKDFRFVSFHVSRIAKYDGYKPLTELETYPFEYNQNKQSIRTSLLERGKKYITFLGVHHCMYEGPVELVGWSGPYSRGGQYSMVCSNEELKYTPLTWIQGSRQDHSRYPTFQR